MARSLWFKQRYVAGILAGEKTDTIRRPGSRAFVVGESIGLSVGPRPPFAMAVVTGFGPVPAESLPPDRLEAARSFYGDHPTYARLQFRVTKRCAAGISRGTAPAAGR